MTDAGFLRGAAALQALAKSWDAVDAAASAHWRHWSDRLEVHDKAVLKQAGFGTIDTRVSWWRQALHDIHQRRFRPLASPSSDYSHTEKAARVIAAAQGRLFDLDMMRQAITVDFIGGKIALNEIDVICVIGDGFGVLSSLLSKMQKKRKIICLNLTRILYVDLLYANKSLDLNEIALAHDENSLHESLHAEGIKIIGVEAKNAQILKSSPTQLAINIASFQEMDPAIVKAYFSIFRSIAEKRKFYVYACNRETKVLSDGVAVNFCEYGWSSRDQIIIDEPCPWHQFFYCLRPPFLKSYDGVHRHRLVQLAPA